MKVENMVNSNGNKVANQFIITDEFVQVFQSYETVIARRITLPNGWQRVELDAKAWDYSTTTGRYRNQFLGETKRETQARIDSGEYELVDLN